MAAEYLHQLILPKYIPLIQPLPCSGFTAVTFLSGVETEV